jgi:hypothetical protein
MHIIFAKLKKINKLTFENKIYTCGSSGGDGFCDEYNLPRDHETWIGDNEYFDTYERIFERDSHNKSYNGGVIYLCYLITFNMDDDK